MEKDLHKVTDGSLSKVELLKTFYKKFMDDYNYVSITMWKYEDLFYKKSIYGEFIGCSNFPEYHYVENSEEVDYVGRSCPKCGKPLVYKMGKNHKKFISCSNYHDCDYILTYKYKKSFGKCPKCGGNLKLSYQKGEKFLSCENMPNCDYRETYNPKKFSKKYAFFFLI